MKKFWKEQKELKPNDCQFVGDPCIKCGGIIRYTKTGRCVACIHRRNIQIKINSIQEKRGTTISQAKRRAIEDHQHKHDEDWYRL